MTGNGNGRGPFEESYFARYGGRGTSYASRSADDKWDSLCRFVARYDRSPERALDYGCADGQFLERAAAFFPRTQWQGADVSSYALEQARHRLPHAALHRIEGPLPIADEHLDVVTALDVLEHVVDLDSASLELARILRPGGVLAAVVPVYDGPVGLLVRLLDRDPTHVHKSSRAWWLTQPSLQRRFELMHWEGAWRYHLGRYWHARGEVGRGSAPAIVMAWRRT